MFGQALSSLGWTLGFNCSTSFWNFDAFCFGVIGCDPFLEQAN